MSLFYPNDVLCSSQKKNSDSHCLRLFELVTFSWTPWWYFPWLVACCVWMETPLEMASKCAYMWAAWPFKQLLGSESIENLWSYGYTIAKTDRSFLREKLQVKFRFDKICHWSASEVKPGGGTQVSWPHFSCCHGTTCEHGTILVKRVIMFLFVCLFAERSEQNCSLVASIFQRHGGIDTWRE